MLFEFMPAKLAREALLAERVLVAGFCGRCASHFTVTELEATGFELVEGELPRIVCPRCHQHLVSLRPPNELMGEFFEWQRRRRAN